MESNLLVPAGITMRWAMLTLKVYRAEDMPQSKRAVNSLSGCTRLLTVKSLYFSLQWMTLLFRQLNTFSAERGTRKTWWIDLKWVLCKKTEQKQKQRCTKLVHKATVHMYANSRVGH